MTDSYRVKQVILVRTDLNMRKGKLAAQVAHASMKVFFDLKVPDIQAIVTQTVWPDEDEDALPPCPDAVLLVPLTSDMEEWVNGTFAKIVLGVEDEETLLAALALAKEAGIPAAMITDLGFTEFNRVPTNTAVAIGPADSLKINRITGPEGLVKTKLL